MTERLHFIAIGGAVMHQLAIYLHKQGNKVSGSDDVIFDPALSQLDAYGLLPPSFGWNADRITTELDGIILGMHAKPDNPELAKAQQLGIKIYSFPEFIYSRSTKKRRIAVAGSHGKTSITAMIMHILNRSGYDFDYLVGSRIEGFDTMVRISDEADLIVLEADEYLSSPIDRRSKFLHYKPDVAIISGIAWDHINVFPTFESYLDTFKAFIDTIDEHGQLIYYANDKHLPELVQHMSAEHRGYTGFPFRVEANSTWIDVDGRSYRMHVFGRHNMENMEAAVLACEAVGIDKHDALKSLEDFLGSAKRLELVYANEARQIYAYRDFAHAPSKLRATVNALRTRYADQTLIGVYELHTYSSLQPEFLKDYAGSLNEADQCYVFLDPHALQIKGRPDIADEVIRKAFGIPSLEIIRSKERLSEVLGTYQSDHTVFALMSSGNFGGFDLDSWKSKLS